MSAFPFVPLRAVTLDAQSGPFGSQLHFDDYVDDGIPVINPSNIINSKIVPNPTVAIGEETSERLARHRLESCDLVFARRGELGRAAVVHNEAVGWLCGTGSLRVRTQQSAFDSRFAEYVLQSASTRAYFEMYAVGSTMGNLNTSIVLGLPIPLPSLDEQRRIADFLDAETARVDGLATVRRRMRDLLTLRRERTLEQLLGIDASPPMIPLKYVVQAVSVGIVITPANWYVDDGGVPALRGVNIQPGHIYGANMVQISQEGHRENMKSRLSAGDVVVVRTGQAGAAAVVPNELDGCNCIDLLIIRPGKRTSASFLAHYLNSFYAHDKITEHSVGSIQAHFNVASMKNLGFPSIDLAEQQRRAEEIDDVLGELDLLNSQLDAQLTLLGERRQALITAAVTGGITV